ncbi:MAG: phosphotransferase [Pseudomonadota bacterium]
MLEQARLAEVLVPFVREITGGTTGTVETMAGDASTRRYHRVRIRDGSPASVVIMELPDDPLKSDEASAGGPPPELPFLNVQRYLAAGGIPVPRVYRADMARGLLALEDLGDRTFESVVKDGSRAERQRYYGAAIEHIAEIQSLGRRTSASDCVAFSRRFDRTLLRWELDHFREWYLEAERGAKLSETERAQLDGAFDWLASELASLPVVLVHRDFQSRNLMVIGEGPENRPQLRVIDFQDALLGTEAYDLVALLRDSYVVLAPDELNELVAAFVRAARVPDEAAFRRLFSMQALQRKMKDIGRFVFIDRVRKNPSFLRWIPATAGYIRQAMAEAPPELAPVARVLARHAPELLDI